MGTWNSIILTSFFLFSPFCVYLKILMIKKNFDVAKNNHKMLKLYTGKIPAVPIASTKGNSSNVQRTVNQCMMKKLYN